MDRALHHQQLGDVVVDGQNGGDLALAVTDIDCGGFEDLAVRRPGQVGQMVPRRRVIGGQLLHHDIGGPVPHLAACDMAVDNIDNGVFRILRGQIVNHNLTVWPELGRQASAICLSISSRLLSKGITFSLSRAIFISASYQHPAEIAMF